MKAKEFRKNWQLNNPKTIHIPSEHELDLMESYAEYKDADSIVLLREVLGENYNINEKYHISPRLREKISVHIIELTKDDNHGM